MKILAFLNGPGKTLFKSLLSSPTSRLISRVSSRNIIATFLAIIGMLVQARYVSPEDLGFLRQYGIVTNYVIFFHLGLWHSLARRYPLYIGKGKRDEAIAVAEICQSWIGFITLLASAVFTILALTSLALGNWRAALAWIVQVVTSGSMLYGGYLGATYMAGHDFETSARSSVISSALGLLCLPVFPFWPYPALILRSSVGGMVSLIYLHMRRPLRLSWRFNIREWWRLLKEGLPMFTASYGFGVGWNAVEMSIIVKYLGTRYLGLWSFSLMAFEMAKILPQSVAAIYMPRLTEQYGRSGKIMDCLGICRKPMILGGAGIVVLTTSICVAAPIFIRELMPKYIEAIPTVCLMMLYLPIIILEMPLTILISLGQVVQQNVTTYFGLICFVALALVNLHFSLGLNGIVAASLFGRLSRTALSYSFVYMAVRSDRKERENN